MMCEVIQMRRLLGGRGLVFVVLRAGARKFAMGPLADISQFDFLQMGLALGLGPAIFSGSYRSGYPRPVNIDERSLFDEHGPFHILVDAEYGFALIR
jgi:hypothetical protein